MRQCFLLKFILWGGGRNFKFISQIVFRLIFQFNMHEYELWSYGNNTSNPSSQMKERFTIQLIEHYEFMSLYSVYNLNI